MAMRQPCHLEKLNMCQRKCLQILFLSFWLKKQNACLAQQYIKDCTLWLCIGNYIFKYFIYQGRHLKKQAFLWNAMSLMPRKLKRRHFHTYMPKRLALACSHVYLSAATVPHRNCSSSESNLIVLYWLNFQYKCPCSCDTLSSEPEGRCDFATLGNADVRAE